MIDEGLPEGGVGGLDPTDLRAFVREARAVGRRGREDVLPKEVRQFIRRQLVPEIIPRMYRVAMGLEKFDVVTEAGNVIQVPAFPSVQMDTAKALVEWGIGKRPLVTDDDQRRPGVIILGTMEQLTEAQQAAERERLRAAGLLEEIAPASSMRYLPPAGHDVVYVDEISEAAPTAVVQEAPMTTKAREILARRAQRGQNGHHHDG